MSSLIAVSLVSVAGCAIRVASSVRQHTIEKGSQACRRSWGCYPDPGSVAGAWARRKSAWPAARVFSRLIRARSCIEWFPKHRNRSSSSKSNLRYPRSIRTRLRLPSFRLQGMSVTAASRCWDRLSILGFRSKPTWVDRSTRDLQCNDTSGPWRLSSDLRSRIPPGRSRTLVTGGCQIRTYCEHARGN